jgi:Protein of unknown function (DUF2490)
MNAVARARRGWILLVICCGVLTVAGPAQQQPLPEDPEDDKRLGLWLDQGISAGLWTNKSLEVEFHQRFDEGGSNLYEYFVQGGVAFRVRPWLIVLPIYRYQRYPPSATTYENRVLLNLTLSKSVGTWRPSLRTLSEGRFPDDRAASARLRFRPGLDFVIPIHTAWRPVLVVNNEFFFVPWSNPYANGGTYTQNRFQIGVRLPATASLSARPYYLVQSVNLPAGWDTNEIIGISLGYRISRKSK